MTLIEVIVVVGIIAVLASLILPNANSLINRAQGPLCTSKLVNLWTVFSSNLNDGNAWPQIPTNSTNPIQIGSLEEEEWWLSCCSTNGMGLKTNDWNCPTITRLLRNATNGVQPHLITYLPTLFDANLSTPSKSASMPWFVEIANVHGNGAKMIRADGAVVEAQVLGK